MLRGVALRDKLLCQTIPEPPANIQDTFPLLPEAIDSTFKPGAGVLELSKRPYDAQSAFVPRERVPRTPTT